MITMKFFSGSSTSLMYAIGHATHGTRSHNAVIRVYDDAGNVIGDAAPLSLPGEIVDIYPLDA
jgi:hypothetical protein